MHNVIVPGPPILTDDQRQLLSLAREAQSGNMVAARALTPVIKRLTAHLEDPMQYLTSDPPAPEPNPLGEEEGDSIPPDRARAFTRQSIAIESRIATCPNCDGIHHVQACPELTEALFAPEWTAPEWTWKDIALGRELCRMKWRNFRAFVSLLMSVPAEHMIIYAASYQAFVRSVRPESDLTINEILQVWTRDMQRGGDRGPAAPAMRLAA